MRSHRLIAIESRQRRFVGADPAAMGSRSTNGSCAWLAVQNPDAGRPPYVSPCRLSAALPALVGAFFSDVQVRHACIFFGSIDKS